ncbi:MAG: glycosyltransferase family 39 protein [Syntrophales bacterium]|nr:glycosyltransferase family 39 protein [Syntrophales bacterium]
MLKRVPLTWYSLGVFCLLIIALALRLQGLTGISLSVDECVMVQFAQGVLKAGYPHRTLGSLSYGLSTYEFLPYPLALFLGIFGLKVFFLRLPAVLFGVATTWLIYLIGTRLFNRHTGFLAALIYAFAPWAINWSQSLFHPAQDQFLGLLTIYLFYRGALESPELKTGYLYGAAAVFSLTYLTWEGYGLLLPVFLIAMFAFRGEDWSWMKSSALWFAALGIMAVVVMELCWRLIAFPPYLLIGNELRHLRTPTLAFMQSSTDFWATWRQFFWGENRALLTGIALAGIPLIRRDRPLAYFYLVIASFPLLLTFFMESLLPHYLYGMFPLLILIAARTISVYLEKIGDLLSSEQSIIAGVVKYGVIVLVVGGVFLGTNDLKVRLYRLNYPAEDEVFYERRHFMWIDFRGGSQFLAKEASATPVMCNMGAYLQLFEGITSNYGVEFFPMVPLFYDYVAKRHTYLEKYVGAQTLRNPQELQEAFCQNRQIYLGISSVNRLEGYIPEFMDFLYKHCQPVYNTFGLQVFRWHK